MQQIKQRGRSYIERDDFAPFMHGQSALPLPWSCGHVVPLLCRTAQVSSWIGILSKYTRISGEIWYQSPLTHLFPYVTFALAITVVARIFYSVDRDSSGRITLRKLRRSNLIAAFNMVDEEGDINKVGFDGGSESLAG